VSAPPHANLPNILAHPEPPGLCNEHEPRLAAPRIHEREEGATRRPIRPRPIWRGYPGIPNQQPRASTVGGPGKKGDHVAKAIFLDSPILARTGRRHPRRQPYEHQGIPTSSGFKGSCAICAHCRCACATLASLLPWAENRARMAGALPSKPHESATANFGISGDLLLANAKSHTPFSRAALVCNHKFLHFRKSAVGHTNDTPSPAPRVEKPEVGARAHIKPGLNYTPQCAPYGPLTSPCQTQNGKEPESMNNKQHMSETHPTAYANQ